MALALARGFIFICRFAGDQTQTSAKFWITQPMMFTCQDLLKHYYTNNVTDTVFYIILCVRYIFFQFYWSIGFKGNNRYTKKGIMSAMECTDVANITFATWRIRSCLTVNFKSAVITSKRSCYVIRFRKGKVHVLSWLTSSISSEFRYSLSNKIIWKTRVIHIMSSLYCH